MLTLAFTYLQIMPEFIDFLLLFGEQEHAQDLFHSGFHQRTRLTSWELSPKVPERNWSGRDLQLCYSLKSVEHSGSQADWPWSIRHCAVHHNFDVENVRSTWVMIKGDDSMKRRLQSATSDRGLPDMSSFGTIDRAFSASLATHLILCDWSAENWRWYIKFLEENFADLTDSAIVMNADVPVGLATDWDRYTVPLRANTQKTNITLLSRASTSFRSFISRTRTLNSIEMNATEPKPLVPMYKNSLGNMQPVPPGRKLNSSQGLRSPTIKLDKFGQRQFRFQDIQEVQDLEERANETVLILKLNLNVISQLTNHYKSLLESNELPQMISRGCLGDMVRFNRRIDGITKDIELQILRVESLLRLLADRKTLVSASTPSCTTMAELTRYHSFTESSTSRRHKQAKC